MLPGRCGLSSCMYNKRNEPYGCGYSKITSIVSNTALTREKRRQSLERVYRVDPDDFEVALRRVVSVVCLNEYFQYLYSKNLMEGKAKEFLAIKNDPVRYQEWRPASRKVKFAELQDTIDFVLSNIK